MLQSGSYDSMLMLAHNIQRICLLFGDCLISYTLIKRLCSICTEIDIATYLKLKYLATHRPQLVFSTAIMPTTVEISVIMSGKCLTILHICLVSQRNKKIKEKIRKIMMKKWPNFCNIWNLQANLWKILYKVYRSIYIGSNSLKNQ